MGKGSSGSQTTSTQSGPPPEVMAQYTRLMGLANNQAAQPLQQYAGPVVAGFTPQQQAAFQTIQDSQGIANPYIDRASQLTMAGSQPVGVPGGMTDGQIAQTIGGGIDATNDAMNAGSETSGLGRQINQSRNMATQQGQRANQYGQQSAQAGGLGSPMASLAMQGLGGVNAATALANDNAGINSQYGQNVQNLAGMAVNASQYDPNQVYQYLNPNTQAVIRATQNQFNDANQKQQQDVIGNAAMKGAWGGDRSAVAQAITAQQQQVAQAPVIAKLQSDAYQQAVQQMQQQQQMKQQSAMAAANLGLGQQQLAAQTAIQGGGLQNSLANTAINEQTLNSTSALNAGKLANETGNLDLASGQLGLGQQNLSTNSKMQGGQQLINAGQNQQQQNTAAQIASRQLAQQGGYGMSALGQAAQNSALSGANAQLQAGAMQQQLAQEKMNVPYQQFQQAQAFPYQTLGWLANLSMGLGSGMGGQSSTTAPGASPVSQLAGLGAAGLGAYGASGGFKAAGGRIERSGGGGLGAQVPTLQMEKNVVNDWYGLNPSTSGLPAIPDQSVSPLTGKSGNGMDSGSGSGSGSGNGHKGLGPPEPPRVSQDGSPSLASDFTSGIGIGKGLSKLFASPMDGMSLGSTGLAANMFSSPTAAASAALGAPPALGSSAFASALAPDAASAAAGSSYFPGIGSGLIGANPANAGYDAFMNMNGASAFPDLGAAASPLGEAFTSAVPLDALEAVTPDLAMQGLDLGAMDLLPELGASALGDALGAGAADIAGTAAADAAATAAAEAAAATAAETIGGESLLELLPLLLLKKGGRVHRDGGGSISGKSGGGSGMSGGKGGGSSSGAPMQAYNSYASSPAQTPQFGASGPSSWGGGDFGGGNAGGGPGGDMSTMIGAYDSAPRQQTPSFQSQPGGGMSGKQSGPSYSDPSQGGGFSGGKGGQPSNAPMQAYSSYQAPQQSWSAPPQQQGGGMSGKNTGYSPPQQQWGQPSGFSGKSSPNQNGAIDGGYRTSRAPIGDPTGSIGMSGPGAYRGASFATAGGPQITGGSPIPLSEPPGGGYGYGGPRYGGNTYGGNNFAAQPQSYGFSAPQLGLGPQAWQSGEAGRKMLFNADGTLNTGSMNDYSPPSVAESKVRTVHQPSLTGGYGDPTVDNGTYSNPTGRDLSAGPSTTGIQSSQYNVSQIAKTKPTLIDTWNRLQNGTASEDEKNFWGNDGSFDAFVSHFQKSGFDQGLDTSNWANPSYRPPAQPNYTYNPNDYGYGGYADGGRIKRDMGGGLDDQADPMTGMITGSGDPDSAPSLGNPVAGPMAGFSTPAPKFDRSLPPVELADDGKDDGWANPNFGPSAKTQGLGAARPPAPSKASVLANQEAGAKEAYIKTLMEAKGYDPDSPEAQKWMQAYIGDHKPQEHLKEREADSFTSSPWMALVNAGLGMASGRSPSFLANLAGGAQQGVKSLGDIAKAKQDLEDKNDTIRTRNQQIDDSESAIKRNAMSFSKSMFDSDRSLKVASAKELAAMEHQTNQDKHQAARDADSHALAGQRLEAGSLDLAKAHHDLLDQDIGVIPQQWADKLGVPYGTQGRMIRDKDGNPIDWVPQAARGLRMDDDESLEQISDHGPDGNTTLKQTVIWNKKTKKSRPVDSPPGTAKAPDGKWYYPVPGAKRPDGGQAYAQYILPSAAP